MVGFREVIEDSMYEMSSSVAYLATQFGLHPEINTGNWVDARKNKDFSIALLRSYRESRDEETKARCDKTIKCLQTYEPFGRLTDKQRVKLELAIEQRNSRKY